MELPSVGYFHIDTHGLHRLNRVTRLHPMFDWRGSNGSISVKKGYAAFNVHGNNDDECTSITEVHPHPKKGVLSSLIDLAENLVVRSLYRSAKPLHYLAGNFAPAEQETPPYSDLPVLGNLPKCLDGEFVGIGSNPRFAPIAGYHWFDGDGCVSFPFPFRFV